jgi:hypothetical protein
MTRVEQLNKLYMGENFVLGHTIGTWDIGTEEKRFLSG